MENDFAQSLATLGHPQRLALFRLLVRRYPDGVAAGELAQALALKSSTLSVYLSTLREAGLIAQARRGTSLLYTADMPAAERLMGYLFEDCCRGRPDLCRPTQAMPGGSEVGGRRFKVLFLCTGNSARSIFAETLLRDVAGARFEVYSAGTQPQSALNPHAVEMLRAKGHDVSGLRAKSVAEFQGPDAPRFDFVFTVCDRAANEDCPAWPGQPVSGHWGQPDPVKATGTEAERRLAFQQAYGALRNRIRAFAALPIRELDRATLQGRVDDIGRQQETE